MQLKNKVAIITGAGGGIGSALAKRLDKEGVILILTDKNQPFLMRLASTIRGQKHQFLEVDLTRTDEVIALFTSVLSVFPRVDFLFNLAGIGTYKKIEDLTLPEWNQSIALNLTAPLVLTKLLLPQLRLSDDPFILNVGSGMGVKPSGGRTAYCASKFGLRGLSLSLSKELKGDIDVSLLTLGSVMDNFGTGGLSKRKKLQRMGKNYLSIKEVVDEIVDITKMKPHLPEYILYPEGY